MAENRKKNTFNSVIEADETYSNKNWIRVKIRTFAFGKNRNGSDILDSSFNDFSKARKSIRAIPIVAKYNDKTDNLEGHNATLRKNKDDEYEVFYDTNALGFTSPTSTFYLEEVNEGTDIEPDNKTYVVIEDVYLWKRFDATEKIIEWLAEGTIPSVSMEIDDVEGQFDSDGYFQIQDFSFIGIAALGTDVEPCFKKAEIQMYTANKFKEDLKILMSELKFSSDSKGGNKMTQENETIEVEAIEEDVVVEAIEAETPEVDENLYASQSDEQVEEEVVAEVEETVKVDSDNPEQSTDTSETYDEHSTSEEAEDVTESAELSDDATETDEQVDVEVIDYEAKLNETSIKLSDLQASHSKLQEQLAELQSYKRMRMEDDLQAKFEGKLSDEEFDTVFAESKEQSIEVIQDKLFALIGKKNFSIQQKKTNTNKVNLAFQKDDVPQSPYGDIFED